MQQKIKIILTGQTTVADYLAVTADTGEQSHHLLSAWLVCKSIFRTTVFWKLVNLPLNVFTNMVRFYTFFLFFAVRRSSLESLGKGKCVKKGEKKGLFSRVLLIYQTPFVKCAHIRGSCQVEIKSECIRF